MTNWIKIASSAEELSFGTNGIAVIELPEKKICLATHAGHWHGFAYKCPHASGIMANGQLDALGNLICPLHHYRFNIKNGRNTSGEGYFLKTYQVEERADGLYVAV